MRWGPVDWLALEGRAPTARPWTATTARVALVAPGWRRAAERRELGKWVTEGKRGEGTNG